MQRTRSNQDIQNSLVDLAVKYNELSPNTQSPDNTSYILPSLRKTYLHRQLSNKQRKKSHDDNDTNRTTISIID